MQAFCLGGSTHCLQLSWADTLCFWELKLSGVFISSSFSLWWSFFKTWKLTQLRFEPRHPECNVMPINTSQYCQCPLSLSKGESGPGCLLVLQRWRDPVLLGQHQVKGNSYDKRLFLLTPEEGRDEKGMTQEPSSQPMSLTSAGTGTSSPCPSHLAD